MPSPVAHTLAGMTICSATAKRKSVAAVFAAIFLANLPDLDFLPGLLAGNANLYHHAETHSLGAMILVVLLVAGLAKACGDNPARWAIIAALAYGSHLLLDFFTVDTRQPYGIPLLWPFATTYVMSPVSVFLDIRRSADPSLFWRSLFSTHNVVAALREFLLLGVPFVVVVARDLRRRGFPSRPSAPNQAA